MLKIHKLVDDESVTFALSGRIEDQDLAHLRSLTEAERRPVVLDLKEVTLAGRDAVRFLVHCQQTGARLRWCPAYLVRWIATERGKRRRLKSWLEDPKDWKSRDEFTAGKLL